MESYSMYIHRRICIVYMSVFLHLNCGFYAITIEIQASYSLDSDKLLLKFIWKDNRPKLADTILRNKIRRLTLSYFSLTIKL